MSFGGRRQVTKPRNRVRWVSWWVLSSKTHLNRPDWRLTKILRFKLFPVSFWSNYLRSNEIYAGFGKISAKSSKISPNPVRSSLDLVIFRLKKQFLTDFSTVDHPTTFQCRSDHSDLTLSPVGGRSKLSPPNLDQPVDTPICTFTTLYQKAIKYKLSIVLGSAGNSRMGSTYFYPSLHTCMLRTYIYNLYSSTSRIKFLVSSFSGIGHN